MTTESTLINQNSIDEGEGIWTADVEQSFLEALALYPSCGRRKIVLTEEGKMYGRNELVARYIKIRTGKIRTRKQVSSHLQVLAKRRSKDLQILRNDKLAQKIILERLKEFSSNLDDNDNQQNLNSKIIQPSETSTNLMKKSLTKQSTSNYLKTDKISFLVPTSPTLNLYENDRSRCTSNTSSLSFGSVGSINPMINNRINLPLALIGDENFRLYDLSAFIELKRTISSPRSFLIYSYSETCSIYQHDLLRLHSHDIQIKNLHTFETILIDKIFDKFPLEDGLKDLFHRNPNGSFFLIKFWTNVFIPTSLRNSFINPDESFFTSYSYASFFNRPIHISTRLCSFGKQVLEKVEISENPQRDNYDQFVYRFDRSPLCDYMVQFIQKLRSLPNTQMMNSVLENFTVLQVIKCRDDTEQLLLCLAFVFEIAVVDSGGSQYQIYKLISN